MSFPKVGTVLHAEIGSARYPTMKSARMDPRNAAAETLAQFLLAQVFVVGAGDDGKEVTFNLATVHPTFPSKGELEYPSASITTPTETVATRPPQPLEETVDRYGPGTVLWKTGELVVDFQVDFFVTQEPHQEAIAAALPAAFNPREDASGVILQGPAAYWCLTVRCSLAGSAERAGDTGEAVFEGERRLLQRVRAEIDVVHLRKAVGLKRPVARLDVLDPKG